MSFFSKIHGKLGIGKKEEDKPQFAGMAKRAGVVKGSAPAPAAAKPAGAPSAMARHEYAKDDDASPAPAAMAMVDVVAKIEGLAQANPAKLNWKVSIVDL